jgi:hypothetical protein
MTRRTLDITFSVGGVLFAVLFVVLALVLRNEYNFAKDYVHDQLGEQKITFAAADKLTDEEKNWKPGSQCLIENAGKQMFTGKQAECYANYYIGLHLETSVATAGYPGGTYATLGTAQTDLRTQIADLKAKNDTTGAADAQKKLDAATSARSTQQTGETLRGLLLTSYGFSIFGERAGQVAIVALLTAALLVILSGAGFVHAFVTPREKVVFGAAAAARPTESAT